MKAKDLKMADQEKKIKLLVETNVLHQKKIELLESEIILLNNELKKKKKKKVDRPKLPEKMNSLQKYVVTDI